MRTSRRKSLKTWSLHSKSGNHWSSQIMLSWSPTHLSYQQWTFDTVVRIFFIGTRDLHMTLPGSSLLSPLILSTQISIVNAFPVGSNEGPGQKSFPLWSLPDPACRAFCPLSNGLPHNPSIIPLSTALLTSASISPKKDWAETLSLYGSRASVQMCDGDYHIGCLY